MSPYNNNIRTNHLRKALKKMFNLEVSHKCLDDLIEAFQNEESESVQEARNRAYANLNEFRNFIGRTDLPLWKGHDLPSAKALKGEITHLNLVVRMLFKYKNEKCVQEATDYLVSLHDNKVDEFENVVSIYKERGDFSLPSLKRNKGGFIKRFKRK